MTGGKGSCSRYLVLQQQLICRRMWIWREARGIAKSQLISFRSDGHQSVSQVHWGLAIQAPMDKRCQLERDSLRTLKA